jgi:hypothetical protein
VLRSVVWVFYGVRLRDRKLSGIFVRFRALLQSRSPEITM